MQVSSKDHIFKVMALTRFHFVMGMPHAGARHLTSLLAQNPRFAAINDGPAAGVFSQMQDLIGSPRSAVGELDRPTQVAMLRGAIDAVHHARPMDAVVLDQSPEWLGQLAQLSDVLPLSRFIVMVRDPAAIAAVMARETGIAKSPRALLAADGVIGKPLGQVETAMNAPVAERMLLIDYDRLLDDPVRVLNTLYSMLREPLFSHDCSHLPKHDRAAPQLPALRRRVLSMSLRSSRATPQSPKPLWQRSSGTAATLLLREAG